jgi:hypothetical protein
VTYPTALLIRGTLAPHELTDAEWERHDRILEDPDVLNRLIEDAQREPTLVGREARTMRLLNDAGVGVCFDAREAETDHDRGRK